MSRLAARALGLALVLATLGGCAASPATAPRPARISHVVLVKLVDEADIPAVLADSDAMLAGIPGVTAYAAGTHLETGRPTVDGGYSVGLYIGFESEAAYAGYVDHPAHLAYVTKWRPRTEWLRIYDILDETP